MIQVVQGVADSESWNKDVLFHLDMQRAEHKIPNQGKYLSKLKAQT